MVCITVGCGQGCSLINSDEPWLRPTYISPRDHMHTHTHTHTHTQSTWLSILPVYLPVCLSVCLSVCLFAYMRVCLPVCLFTVQRCDDIFWPGASQLMCTNAPFGGGGRSNKKIRGKSPALLSPIQSESHVIKNCKWRRQNKNITN